ncbi:N-acetylmuramoyl-L-alanine amidase [Acuticoccus mangrovi]|uniref:N-acetylmuramoyl-L-alanine amidase n=1 Tax=Acuticoccus mangrovi TaxID=2796142 RepID=A0A934IRS7_9HYPH|nr:N-acetylmuramoyl-L-alanine amidase [Acuticoccus mangrovi]MBJ3777470.1 N-acetylmuramoyl-L-alanine amidase [Acuticoccus mangrovi]
MSVYDEEFFKLVSLLGDRPVEFPTLRPAHVAQWILESDRGLSDLARRFHNFGGMKYRSELAGIALPIAYEAHDGLDTYCAFPDNAAFLEGYFRFLDRSPYRGWRDHAASPEAFLSFIGPIWAGDPAYVTKVLGLLPEASDLLKNATTAGVDDAAPDPTPSVPGRPYIRLDGAQAVATGFDGLKISYKGDAGCPYGIVATQGRRPFTGIILHHTQPGKSAAWYVRYQIDGDSDRGGHFGYHFYIGEDGTVLQGAPLDKRTNHISSKADIRRSIGSHLRNSNAIGVSFVGAGFPSGSKPTPFQEAAAEVLVYALADHYEIPFDSVFGHGEIQRNRMASEGRDVAQRIRSW